MTTTKEKKFSPEEHMTDIKGKQYLPVAWRLVWFREEHPDWTIRTEIVENTDVYAVMRAIIANPDRVLATAHKKEDKVGFGDYMEKAETGAVGRALAMCGYGTQFAPELEEGTERIVDSPQEKKVVKEPVKEEAVARKERCQWKDKDGECSEVLTPAVAKFSQGKYGKFLCFKHQKHHLDVTEPIQELDGNLPGDFE